MKGKRFGIVVATIAMIGVLLSPTGVQAAVSVGAEVAADDTSLKWDEGTTIRWNTTISSGGWGYFNGTIYINLTSPSSAVYSYTSTVVLNETVTDDWYNFSYDPRDAGVWNITANVSCTDGENNITIPDSYGTFSVERQGQWMSRTIQDWSALIWLILMVMVLIVILLIMVDRVNKGNGNKGSGGKK